MRKIIGRPSGAWAQSGEGEGVADYLDMHMVADKNGSHAMSSLGVMGDERQDGQVASDD